jgi:hypothetical protein
MRNRVRVGTLVVGKDIRTLVGAAVEAETTNGRRMP